jgi:hypothetical protein
MIYRFWDRLMARVTKAVFLILDGPPLHKSGKVGEKIRVYKGRWCLYLQASCSPELNPDEGAWRGAKSRRLGRAGVFSFADMESGVLGALHHLVYRSDRIQAIFHIQMPLYAA